MMIGQAALRILGSLWGYIKAAGIWLWKNPIVLVGMLGAAVGAWLVYVSSRNKVEELEDALEVQAIRKRVVKQEARAELMKEQAEAVEPKVKQLKKKVAESKRRVMQIERQEDLEGMNDDEIAEAFNAAGF